MLVQTSLPEPSWFDHIRSLSRIGISLPNPGEFSNDQSAFRQSKSVRRPVKLLFDENHSGDAVAGYPTAVSCRLNRDQIVPDIMHLYQVWTGDRICKMKRDRPKHGGTEFIPVLSLRENGWPQCVRVKSTLPGIVTSNMSSMSQDAQMEPPGSLTALQ